MTPYQIGTGGGHDGVEIFGETGVTISVRNQNVEKTVAIRIGQDGVADFSQQPTVNGQPMQVSGEPVPPPPSTDTASKLSYGTVTFRDQYYISLLNTDGKKRSLTIAAFAAPTESRLTWTDSNVLLELNDWDYQSNGLAALLADINHGNAGSVSGTPGGIIGTNYAGAAPIKPGMSGNPATVVGETAWDDMNYKAEGTSRITMAPDDFMTATADVFGMERVKTFQPNNNPDWATTLIEKAQHWQGKYFWATDDFKRILFVGDGDSVELYGSDLGATGKIDIFVQQVNQGCGYSHVGSAQINVSDGSKYVGMISDIDTVFATDGSTENSQYGFHTENGGVQLDNHSGVDALLVCTFNPIMF